MAKNITFEHKKTQYTLEYSRETVRLLYAAGYLKKLADSDTLGAFEVAAYHAFLMHQPKIKPETALEIVADFAPVGVEADDEGLFKVLIDMIAEALDETVLSKKGNIKWQVNA